MIVISDASPIIALENIGRLDILEKVYTHIVITDKVAEEIGISIPSWISVTAEYDAESYKALRSDLDPGEASSIAYCIENSGSLLIIDERKGRKMAKDAGIKIVGLLGVIVLARRLDDDFDAIGCINSLVDNGFRVSDKIIKIIMHRLQ